MAAKTRTFPNSSSLHHLIHLLRLLRAKLKKVVRERESPSEAVEVTTPAGRSGRNLSEEGDGKDGDDDVLPSLLLNSVCAKKEKKVALCSKNLFRDSVEKKSPQAKKKKSEKGETHHKKKKATKRAQRERERERERDTRTHICTLPRSESFSLLLLLFFCVK